jgi:hypothetical protein
MVVIIKKKNSEFRTMLRPAALTGFRINWEHLNECRKLFKPHPNPLLSKEREHKFSAKLQAAAKTCSEY